MKKIYIILGIAAAFATNSIAQSAISGCKLSTNGIRVIFDDSKSCKSELKTLAKIGFHSGVTIGGQKWQSVVPADKDGYIAGVAKGGGKFWVDIPNYKSYYGITQNAEELCFVFNQHPADPAMPWGKEGKGKNADPTKCDDFFLVLAGLQNCSSSIEDALLNVNVEIAPNPMDNFAVLTIAGAKEAYSVQLTSVSGQVVRTYTNVNETLVIEKENLTKGLYFVIIKNEAGKFQSQKLIIE